MMRLLGYKQVHVGMWLQGTEGSQLRRAHNVMVEQNSTFPNSEHLACILMLMMLF